MQNVPTPNLDGIKRHNSNLSVTKGVHYELDRHCKNTRTIVISRRGGAGTDIAAITAKCRSWDCPYCRAEKAQQYRYRIKELFGKDKVWLYTFTMYHSKFPIETWQEIAPCWNRLRTALTKQFGAIKYVRVLETHVRSPYPHLHVLMNTLLPTQWLGDELRRAGFGWSATCKRVADSGGIGEVTKYLTKPWKNPQAWIIRKQLKLRLITLSQSTAPIAVQKEDWEVVNHCVNMHEGIARVHEIINTEFSAWQDMEIIAASEDFYCIHIAGALVQVYNDETPGQPALWDQIGLTRSVQP
jgi:hypothetical protein